MTITEAEMLELGYEEIDEYVVMMTDMKRRENESLRRMG